MGEKVLSEILNLATIQSPQVAYDKKSTVETPDKNSFLELMTQASEVYEQAVATNIPSNSAVQIIPKEAMVSKEVENNIPAIGNEPDVEVANTNELEGLTEIVEVANANEFEGLAEIVEVPELPGTSTDTNLADTNLIDENSKATNFVVIEKQVAGECQRQIVNYNLDSLKHMSAPVQAIDKLSLELSNFENDAIQIEPSTSELLSDELYDDNIVSQIPDQKELENIDRQYLTDLFIEPKLKVTADKVLEKPALLDVKYSRETTAPSIEVKKDDAENESLVSNKDVLNILNKASFIKPKKETGEAITPDINEYNISLPIVESKEANIREIASREANIVKENVREVNIREVEPAFNIALPQSLVIEANMKLEEQPSLITSSMEREQFISLESFDLENIDNMGAKQVSSDLVKSAVVNSIAELAVEDLEPTVGNGDASSIVNPKVLQGFQSGLFAEGSSNSQLEQLDTLNHALKEVEYKLSANKNSQNIVDHIRIELHPESLGRVDINFKQETDGAVKVDILCETFEAMSLLKNSEERINAILGDNGFSSNKNSLNFGFSENKNNQNGRQMQFEASLQNQPANQEVESYNLVKKYGGIMMVDDGKLDIKV